LSEIVLLDLLGLNAQEFVQKEKINLTSYKQTPEEPFQVIGYRIGRYQGWNATGACLGKLLSPPFED
jgi:hypothetical protein